MEKYEWNWYKDKIISSLGSNTLEHQKILAYVEKIDLILQEALNHPISPFSDRPQDYVACITMTRCFRLLISGLSLILSGFPESASNLNRTIWEIGIRLSYINEKDPTGGAFGWLLNSYNSELKMLKKEHEKRLQKNEVQGNLGINIKSVEKNIEVLRKKMEELKYIPDKLINKYGKIPIGNICDNLKIRVAYDVSFNYLSGFVHEQFRVTEDISIQTESKLLFLLGPKEMIKIETKAQIMDILMDTLIAIGTGNEILEKYDLAKEVKILIDKLSTEDIFA